MNEKWSWIKKTKTLKFSLHAVMFYYLQKPIMQTMPTQQEWQYMVKVVVAEEKAAAAAAVVVVAVVVSNSSSTSNTSHP